MERIALVEYKVSQSRIMKFYYAKYRVNYERFSKEIFDTIPDSEKEVRVEFYEDRLIKTNIVKNEKNTYLYDEMFYIEKTENEYLFYFNKNDYIFFEFTEFKKEELEKLDSILKKYYEKETENIIAKIEDFEWTEKRIRKGLLNGNMKYRMIIVSLILIYFISNILIHLQNGDILKNLAGIVGILLLLIGYLTYVLKVYPKRILKSMNSTLTKMRTLFYEDKMVSISKSEPRVLEIKYSEFYKIKRFKMGYLLYTQKNHFYLFEFSEMTGNIEELKKILTKYHKRGKK